MRVPTNVSLGILLTGAVLFSLGLLILLFYFAVYSTADFPNAPELGSSYNVGKMHNRLIGVIVGLGFQIVGAVVVMVERKQE